MLTHAEVAANDGHKVDGVRPAVKRAIVDGDTIALTWSEALDAGSKPAAADFEVTVADSPVSLANEDPVSIDGNVVTLTLASTVSAGEEVAVSYTGGAHPIRDVSGNDAADFAGLIATDATSTPDLPAISGARLDADTLPGVDANLNGTADSFVEGDSFSVQVEFSHSVEVDTGGSNANVQVVVEIGATERALSYAGATGARLSFGPYTVVAADADTDGIRVVPDASGNLVRLSGSASVKGDASSGATPRI